METTFVEFFVFGIFPFAFFVFFLFRFEKMAPLHNITGLKKKIMQAFFGLGGAFITLGFWTHLAK